MSQGKKPQFEEQELKDILNRKSEFIYKLSFFLFFYISSYQKQKVYGAWLIASIARLE